MNKKIKSFLWIILITIVTIGGILGLENAQATTTGNTVYISKAPDSQKIGVFHTYRKSGSRSLDLYCAQKGGSIDSWNNYIYNEHYWDTNAGIWAGSSRATNAYEKITWIKDNFWEQNSASSTNKYTTAQKVKFLQQADSSITETDVKNVFDNSNEKFKLYQIITWTYTNGRESAPTNWITGSTAKVYNAIIKLANANFANYNKTQYVKLTETSKINKGSNGTYTWGLKLEQLCYYPVEYVLKVDGNVHTKYNYDGNTLTINEVSDGDHSFEFSTTSYQVSSTSSIWRNSSKQDLLEITSTTKKTLTDTVSADYETEGFYSLQIKKVDEEGKEIKDTEFTVEGIANPILTGDNGIGTVVTEVPIDGNNKTYTYKITETKVGERYLQLENPINITLKSGVKKSGDSLVYAITNAYFDESGTSELEVSLSNGSVVTLSLGLATTGKTTMVTLTVPNKERIYDLALIKTIVIPSSEVAEKYDLNFDGRAGADDASYLLSFVTMDGYFLINCEQLRDRLSRLDETRGTTYYELYYQYYSDEELWDRFDIDDDGSINTADAGKLLGIYAETAVGMNDRLNYTSVRNLNVNGVETATYNLDKTIRKVKRSDIITYRISVYNEGNYDAKDIEVTDYLPEGLSVCDLDGNVITSGEVTYGNTTWKVDGKKATTTISNTIKQFKDSTLDYKTVCIYCKMDDSVANDEVLYNVAEISKSTPIDSEGNPVKGVTDRDSEENSLSSTNNLIEEYKENFTNTVSDDDSRNVNKDLYDYDDDDDFERVTPKNESEFDLSLRKSITKIGKSESTMEEYVKDVEEDDGNIIQENRLPKITNQSADECIRTGTGAYYHGKEVIQIDSDDYVEYTIRIYNEGAKEDFSGYAKQVTDYLPEGLKFHAIVDADGKWITESTNGKYTTTKNGFGSYEAMYDETNNKLIIDCIDALALEPKNNLAIIAKVDEDKAQSYYNPSETISSMAYCYQEIKIICGVSSSAKGNANLTNIAEITSSVAVNSAGNEDIEIKDRDSVAGTISISNTTDKEAQKVNLDTYYNDVEVDDIYNTYYPGLEDDDDFETVKIETVPGTFDIELIKYISGTSEPLSGAVFTIKVECNGTTVYEKEGLKTGANGKLETPITGLPISNEGENYKVTLIETAAPVGYAGVSEITFNAASILNEDKSSYVLKTENPTIENELATVEITSNNIKIEVDNTPQEADLALRKFITAVDGVELTGESSREPSVDLANLVDGTSSTADYDHEKTPVLVANGQIVTYTLRIYNEGSMDVYASLIKDDIPDGLEFVQYTEGDGSINDIYRWKLVDENDNEVTDITKAKYIVTDYLAKDAEEANLLKAFDPDTMDELDYRDVKVQFKVTEPNTSDRIITNYAQISEETNKEGTPVTDRDSTPNEWKNEDDEDTEKVRVLCFDLALRKWVTQAIVIENGQTTVTETGHKAEDDPEDVVKVDLKKSKIDDVTVKFRYSIRITNEGEIAGEAEEISDYIPAGLKFMQEDNPDWKEVDGKVVTNKLDGVTLEPGESAEVEIILTWVNSENNMGVMVNTAEISKDYNKYGTPDIDSTPNNKVPKEDDIDDAPVMISVTTGQATIMIMSLALGVVTIIGTGVTLIKKYV